MHNVILISLAIASLVLLALPAQARIRCDGNFQIQKNGDRIYTPYCANHNVAAVARQYGMRVSGDAVHNNPAVKEQACRLVGYDLRVKDACTGYRPEGGGRRF